MHELLLRCGLQRLLLSHECLVLLGTAHPCAEHDAAAFQHQRIRRCFSEICEEKVTNEQRLERNKPAIVKLSS
jgi:succinylglutamate desuccinylase